MKSEAKPHFVHVYPWECGIDRMLVGSFDQSRFCETAVVAKFFSARLWIEVIHLKWMVIILECCQLPREWLRVIDFLAFVGWTDELNFFVRRNMSSLKKQKTITWDKKVSRKKILIEKNDESLKTKNNNTSCCSGNCWPEQVCLSSRLCLESQPSRK